MLARLHLHSGLTYTRDSRHRQRLYRHAARQGRDGMKALCDDPHDGAMCYFSITALLPFG
mgnify:CR=1 FL=1